MLGTPSRDRVAERREATRQEILDAAWHVAREKGLAQLTLKDVADLVGMRPPSLYSHFASKTAIYDAMFADAWAEYHALLTRAIAALPDTPRARLHELGRIFFDFAAADIARHQLMNQSILPGFEPTPEAYAPSVRTMELFVELMTGMGLTDTADIDLATSVITGLVNQQLANDPGGDRFSRLLGRAIDMYADHVGLPQE